MTKFVVYTGEGECFVTRKRDEKSFLEKHFSDDSGREIEDYYRKVVDDDCVYITVSTNIFPC